MKRSSVKRIGLVAGFWVASLIGAEVYLRRSVPHCGVTPFRLTQYEGLSAELRPGFSTLYKGHQVSINSSGYRGPEIQEKTEGVKRIAVLGDSFVFGNSLALDDTLPMCLGREMDGAEAVSFGVPGYTAGNVAAVLERDALAHDPDVVLYAFYCNDHLPSSQWKEIPEDAVIDGMHGFPLHSALAQWLNVQVKFSALRLFGLQLARRTSKSSEAAWREGGRERVKAALLKMKALCSSAEIPLVVCIYPNLTFVGKNPFRPFDDGMLELCAELEIECHDLLGAFPGEVDLLVYWAGVFDSHPNGECNQRVAEFLAPILNRL